MSASEHNFTEDVLKSGEALDGFTADGDISARKAVTVNGDKQVTEVSSAGSAMRGVAVYDIADGEELPVAADGCEVLIEVGQPPEVRRLPTQTVTSWMLAAVTRWLEPLMKGVRTVTLCDCMWIRFPGWLSHNDDSYRKAKVAAARTGRQLAVQGATPCGA